MEAPSFQSHTGNPTLSKVLLCCGLLLVLWHTFVMTIPETLQWILFGSTIMLAGIPHGALDHLVAKQNSLLQQRSFSSLVFYTTYFSRMAIFAVCWYFFPTFSLLLFIVMSAFHFGETDLVIPVTASGKHVGIVQTLYGLLILLLLLLTHSREVLPILAIMEENNASILPVIFQQQTIWIILSCLFISLLASIVWLNKKQVVPMGWYLKVFLQTGCMIAIIILLPLPLAFAFYFGCWHSLHSLENIRQHLSKAEGKELSFSTILKKCIPYSLIAFIGIALLIALANYSGNQYVILLLFFIGIAVLTAPHLEVMSHMYAQLRKKTPD